jgi:DNA polymerase III alpha subunit
VDPETGIHGGSCTGYSADEIRRAPGHQHFSFLRGASQRDELFATAQALGIEALGIVDRNSALPGSSVPGGGRETGFVSVVGCRLDLQDGMSILVYPTDRAAYSRLTRLLSLGKERGGKGNCILHLGCRTFMPKATRHSGARHAGRPAHSSCER